MSSAARARISPTVEKTLELSGRCPKSNSRARIRTSERRFVFVPMLHEGYTAILMEALKKWVLPNFVTVHKCVRNRHKEEKSLLMKGHITIESPCYILQLQQCLQRSLQYVSLTWCTDCDNCEFLLGCGFPRSCISQKVSRLWVHQLLSASQHKDCLCWFGSGMYTPKSDTVSWTSACCSLLVCPSVPRAVPGRVHAMIEWFPYLL